MDQLNISNLVAKGYNQLEGVNFDDTLIQSHRQSYHNPTSLVCRSHNQMAHQTTGRHGDLSELVFMKQPPGFW